MGATAGGAFEITSFAPELFDEGSAASLGRVTLVKAFTGALEGASTVTMLTVADGGGTPLAYVALERFTGELDGRKGSFVLQHSAPGSGGERLVVRVVEGTGSGELAGISGTLEIVQDEGGHTYLLEYELG